MTTYIVTVTFYNVDMDYEWTRLFALEKEPTAKWLKSLYDGNNEPKDFKILGILQPLEVKA